MYDNRATKKNPKQPDFKCKRYKEGCEGVIWPPKYGKATAQPVQQQAPNIGGPIAGLDDDDDLPPPVDEAYTDQKVVVQSAKLDALASVHEACFDHALDMAAKARHNGFDMDPAGLSALCAQLFIAATSHR